MDALVFKTEIYEGPLDLLLALIEKNKMSIFDIHIAPIFDQYMTYLHEMEKLDMEIAGEFITMASELMLIKSRMLLPKAEKEDPRQALVEKLMDYRLAKEAAGWLSGRESEFAGRYEKDTDEIEPDKTVTISLDALLLGKAMQHILLRLSEKEQIERDRPNAIAPIIRRKIVPVQGRIVYILRLMVRKKTVHIDEIFEQVESRSELVALFYALLELVRVGRLEPSRAYDDETGSNIILRLNTEKIKQASEEATIV